MALFGPLDTLRSQVPAHPGFATAFDYAASLLRSGSPAAARLREMSKGESRKVDLGDGVFAIEQVYDAKPRAEGFFESHRAYIDVQVIVDGAEAMEVADLSRAVVREPYQADRDLLMYQDIHDASVLRMRAGEAAVFFPADVHMPSLQLEARPGLVRKTVVKVPVR